ncbi:hypothetical protein PT974_11471 [Cladobotryum mycophilum]|uniref:Uncharacterized protein n=1 Tax=Cladobotryum mycophilum TaxID=491253 RepID=A0ABR0S5B2_9HYPO
MGGEVQKVHVDCSRPHPGPPVHIPYVQVLSIKAVESPGATNH